MCPKVDGNNARSVVLVFADGYAAVFGRHTLESLWSPHTVTFGRHAEKRLDRYGSGYTITATENRLFAAARGSLSVMRKTSISERTVSRG